MKYSLAFLGEGWLYCHMEHDWQKDYRRGMIEIGSWWNRLQESMAETWTEWKEQRAVENFQIWYMKSARESNGDREVARCGWFTRRRSPCTFAWGPSIGARGSVSRRTSWQVQESLETYALVDVVPDAGGGVVESAADKLDRVVWRAEVVGVGAYISMAKADVKTTLRKT
jgi:hypothetical protein